MRMQRHPRWRRARAHAEWRSESRWRCRLKHLRAIRIMAKWMQARKAITSSGRAGRGAASCSRMHSMRRVGLTLSLDSAGFFRIGFRRGPKPGCAAYAFRRIAASLPDGSLFAWRVTRIISRFIPRCYRSNWELVDSTRLLRLAEVLMNRRARRDAGEKFSIAGLWRVSPGCGQRDG